MVAFQELVSSRELNACFSVGYNDQFADAAALPNCITEPCDAIHWIRFNRDLYLIAGETKYVDAIESAFCNAYLAKADVVGTPEPELISEKSIYGSDPKLRLDPISAPGVWGAWNLIIGEENPRCIPVCDFISAGDEFKSLGMRFNLWF